MSASLDSLIRKSKDLETQIEQLTTELTNLRNDIATRMGEHRDYYGHGVAAKKWARVRWEINKELLLDELSADGLDFLKEVVLTKEKLDQAVRAGHLPPRLYDRAVRREQTGWNVSLKIFAPSERATEWANVDEEV
jgi:hypothetical protein